MVGVALDALAHIIDVLWPDAIDLEPADPELMWFAVIGNMLRRVLALPFLGLLYLVDALRCRASQRAEYLADLAGARTAGVAAARSSLLRLLSLEGVQTRASSAVRRREDVWTALQRSPQPPENELRRLLRESELLGHQEDDTHPPTHLRVQLVNAAPATTASVVLDSGRLLGIERELHPVRERLRERYTDSLLE